MLSHPEYLARDVPLHGGDTMFADPVKDDDGHRRVMHRITFAGEEPR